MIETLDADEPGSVPLHGVHLVDAGEGDAPVDVRADPLPLLRPLPADLLLADGHRLLVPHHDPELGPQHRPTELEADPVALNVLSQKLEKHNRNVS